MPIIILTKNDFLRFELEKIKNKDLYLLKKPFLINDLKIAIDNVTKLKNKKLEKSIQVNIPNLERTDKTKSIFDAIVKIIKNDLNVLIFGESGTGKKQVATTINNLTSDKKILEINYLDYKNKNLDDFLLNKLSVDSFLNTKNLKVMDISENILITDIDKMSLKTQNLLYYALKAKKKNCLNFLKNKRIIATTSKNIKNSLRNNNFSNELFYQLDMYNIFTIPIRERSEDIPLLIKNIVNEYNNTYNTKKEIEEGAFLDISKYIWPGNTMQLKKFIFRCLKINIHSLIKKNDIIQELSNEFTYEDKNYFDNWKINFRKLVSNNIRGYLNNNKRINTGIYYNLIKDFEIPLLMEVLKFTNNNQLLSSDILGINRNTLRKKMSDYDIKVLKHTMNKNDDKY